MTMLTAEELKKRVRYDEVSGLFTWLPKGPTCAHYKRWNTRYAGKVAGSVNKILGYRVICIDDRYYWAHRLAWLYVNGNWPSDQIDHLDGNKSNNAIANLREADNAQNNCNRSLQSNNTSGFKGVSFSKTNSRWIAQIKSRGKYFHLGYFGCRSDAAAAYRIAADKLHGEFANDGRG